MNSIFKLSIPKLITFVLMAHLLSACSTNPVTQDLELDLVSETEELSFGAERYQGIRQREQGDYVVDTELAEYVNAIGKKLTAVSDRDLPYEFAIVNSSDFNAWALPGGKIAINRGVLVHLECESQLAAILAHEIIHAAAGHGAKKMSKQFALSTVGLVSSLIIDNEKYNWR